MPRNPTHSVAALPSSAPAILEKVYFKDAVNANDVVCLYGTDLTSSDELFWVCKRSNTQTNTQTGTLGGYAPSAGAVVFGVALSAQSAGQTGYIIKAGIVPAVKKLAGSAWALDDRLGLSSAAGQLQDGFDSTGSFSKGYICAFPIETALSADTDGNVQFILWRN